MKTPTLKKITLFVALLISSYSLNAQITLDIKAFLEGPIATSEMSTSLNSGGFIPLQQPFNSPPWNYNGTEQVAAIPNADVVDWVLVELRETVGSAATAYSGNRIARQAGFILKNGNIRAIDGSSMLTFTNTISYNLYVVIYHRNHLSVMSANPLTLSGGVYSYNFSTSSTKAYGGSSAHKLIGPGIWGKVAGDGNADGQVSALDKNSIWLPQAGTSGYKGGDFNLNGQVNNIDKIEKWGVNSGKSSQIPNAWYCGSIVPVIHTAGNVAPVNKTVEYGTVLTNLSGSDKCWITQNLGSDHQATSATDATEASAGWYWQFNKKQGYKHDGTTPTPSWTITNIDENSDWLTANDPCTSLLGSGWRLPTYTEWNNADVNGGWNNYNQTYASVLKLHAAGYINSSNGVLVSRGSTGYYWSSTQVNSTNGWYLYIDSGNSNIYNYTKAYGFSSRCLRQLNLSPLPPSNPSPPNNSTNQQINIQLSWTCTDPENDPLTYDVFFGSVNPPVLVATGQTANSYNPGTLNYITTYYWKIVAHDNQGNTNEGSVWTFTTSIESVWTCGQTLSKNHLAGDVAPVNKSVDYGTLETNLTGSNMCWITQNLGADQQAVSATDNTEASAGWYWQFNRKQGYKSDGTSVTPAWTVTSIFENSDWTVANDPCAALLGTGWRIPTLSEWENADLNGAWDNNNQAYASVLKLHSAGRLLYTNGSLGFRGTNGYYWSATQESNGISYNLYFGSDGSYIYDAPKAMGYSVRCLKEVPTWSCGATLLINHTAGDVAPVTKTVTYGTVETNLTGNNKCWITQNLGSDQQAVSATDATEASAGWYWQFNRKQGYKHDGTTLTPSWTVTYISENSNWLLANDPCTLLLGNGWRLPTRTEWTNADANGGWNNYNQTYASVLKLHAAGYLGINDGLLYSRGAGVGYWCSTQYSDTNGWGLYFGSSYSNMSNNSKVNGFSGRCLSD